MVIMYNDEINVITFCKSWHCDYFSRNRETDIGSVPGSYCYMLGGLLYNTCFKAGVAFYFPVIGRENP